MPAHHGKFVSYYRVSTDRQGPLLPGSRCTEGGSAAAPRRWPMAIEEFVEIESGKRSEASSTRCGEKWEHKCYPGGSF